MIDVYFIIFRPFSRFLGGKNALFGPLNPSLIGTVWCSVMQCDVSVNMTNTWFSMANRADWCVFHHVFDHLIAFWEGKKLFLALNFCVMECDGVWWSVMECDGVWWSVMECDAVWYVWMWMSNGFISSTMLIDLYFIAFRPFPHFWGGKKTIFLACVPFFGLKSKCDVGYEVHITNQMKIWLSCDYIWSTMVCDMYFIIFLPFPRFLGRKRGSFVAFTSLFFR